MKFISKRVSYKKQEEDTTIIISPKTSPLKESLLFGWLSLWSFIGLAFLYSSFFYKEGFKFNPAYSQKEVTLYLFIFFLFWVYFEFKIIKIFIWRKYGSEFIKIDNSVITIKRAIGKYGKKREYLLANITDFTSALPEKETNLVWSGSFWDIGHESVVFHYFNKNISFGRQLNKKETSLLIKLLAPFTKQGN